MSFTNDESVRLREYVTRARDDEELELECAVISGSQGVKRESFERMLSALRYKNIAMNVTTTLDISLHLSKDVDERSLGRFRAHRLTIEGEEAILQYCRSNQVSADASKVIKKQRLNDAPPMKPMEFPVVFRLKREEEAARDRDAFVRMVQGAAKKHYRHKKRFSFDLPGSMFRVDLTLLKTGVGQGMVDAGVLVSPIKYEMEVEYIRREGHNVEEVVAGLEQHALNLAKVVYNTNFPVGPAEIANVIRAYLAAIGSTSIVNQVERSPRNYFIGPKITNMELRNLTREERVDTVSVAKGYAVTEKADGERTLLFITGNKVYLIDDRMNIRGTGLGAPPIVEGCLLDGEYVTRGRDGRSMSHFYAFDAYIGSEGVCTRLPLSERMRVADLVISRIVSIASAAGPMPIVVNVKEMRYPDPTTGKDVFALASDILNSEEKLPYDIDGLVYTPIDLPVAAEYPGQEIALLAMRRTWEKAFKWKPIHHLTIDFLITFDINQVLFMDEQGPHVACKLMVGADSNQVQEIDPVAVLEEVSEGTVAGPRRPDDVSSYVPMQFADAYLPVVKVGDMWRLDTEAGESVQTGTIVEFAYDDTRNDGYRWVPSRVRHDKTEMLRSSGSISNTANDMRTAQRTMASILRPSTRDHVTGRAVVPPLEELDADDTRYYASSSDKVRRSTSAMIGLRNFHNTWIKDRMLIGESRNMLMREDPSRSAPKLLDMACGMGGDISKWLHHSYALVVGMDVNRDNILRSGNGAYSRYMDIMKTRRIATPMVFLQMDATRVWDEAYFQELTPEFKSIARSIWGIERSDVPVIDAMYGVASDGFDVVSVQFAIHYFYKDEETLSGFVENLKKSIRPGGYFIGTCLDGRTVMEELERSPQGKIAGIKNGRVIWQISRAFPTQTQTPFYIGMPIDVYVETIGRIAREYIVDFQHLVATLEVAGLEMIHTGMFNDAYDDYYSHYHPTESQSRRVRNVREFVDMSDQEKTYSFMNRWFIFRTKIK